ncbi:MAG: gliding motility-associated C-terminal domain-containing protein [Schleiferiaceae bacterium]
MNHRLRSLVAAALLLGIQATGQTISLVQTPNLSKCTGDSLRLELNVAGSAMASNNHFRVMMAPGAPTAFTTANSDTLPIVKLRSILPLPVGTDSNSVGTKYVWVIVSDSIKVNGFYSVVIQGSSPVLWSDTIQLLVNVSPPAEVVSIVGGFDNLHTGGPDWGFCPNDTLTLYANTGQNGYQWYKDGTLMAGETNDSLLVYNSGTYSVEVSNGVCTKMSADTIVNMFQPTTSLVHKPGTMTTIEILDKDAVIDSIGFCETEFIQLEGPTPMTTGTGILYQWLRDSVGLFGQTFVVPIPGANQVAFSTNEGGVYYLETVWNPGGCPDTSDAFWLFVDSVPDTEIQPLAWPGQTQASLSYCQGDSIQLAAITAQPGWTYQWQVRYPAGSGNWSTIPNQTSDKLTVTTAIAPGSAEYRLQIENDYCTHISSELLVTVFTLPTVTVAPADSLALCAGDSVLVGVTGNSTSYLWVFPGGSFSGASFYAKVPGTYVVAGTNANGCTSYDTLKVYYFTVNADAGPDQTVLPGSTVQLNATGGLLYYWYANVPTYFSDPYNPNAQTVPTQDTTMYIVEVLNSYGCFDTDTMFVYTFDPATLIPDLSNVMNVITPNGDGYNDVFDLSELVRADSCDLVILDRWGAQVFEQKRYVSGWDGTNQGGDPLPDGTYYYLLVCDDVIRFRGAITVVRP